MNNKHINILFSKKHRQISGKCSCISMLLFRAATIIVIDYVKNLVVWCHCKFLSTIKTAVHYRKCWGQRRSLFTSRKEAEKKIVRIKKRLKNLFRKKSFRTF